MDWSGSDHAESFGLFRQKMELYLEDEDITETAAQARKICRGLGDEGLRRLNASGLKTADKKKPSELWKFFESTWGWMLIFEYIAYNWCSIGSVQTRRWMTS